MSTERIVKGKYGEAKVFTDVVDDKAIDQIKELLDQEFIKGSKVRIMPDVHAGAGCVIGTTMTIKDKVVPNLVGVDIGCGMEVSAINDSVTNVLKRNTLINLSELDDVIHEKIPSGFNIRNEPHPYINRTHIEDLYCKDHINLERAKLSLGTLGGGNHFIELDKATNGMQYLVIHSGSRHLGVEVANYYQETAYQLLYKNTQKKNELIQQLKEQGREKDIQTELKKLSNDIPKHLAYCEGELFDQYIHDMRIVQEYASWNRKAMTYTIFCEMRMVRDDPASFTTIHNYIDTENMILRKGAVSASPNEKLIIPLNMRDGSLICEGLGNPDWNYSAPHGAGRIMSRKEAKSKLDLAEFKDQMKSVYSTSVSIDTIDESPMAYKNALDIIDNISDTVKTLFTIKPIYNFKAQS